MPLSRSTLNQLAALVTPAIDAVLAPVRAQLPALGGIDLGAVTLWLLALTDPQLVVFFDALPVGSSVVAAARAEVVSAPVPGNVPPTPPTRTILGQPHVDRELLWDALFQLRDSDQRVLLVRGDERVGKSRTVELVRAFINDQRPHHKMLSVDLEGIEVLPAAIANLRAEFPGAAVQFFEPTRFEVDGTDKVWGKSMAKAAFNWVRAVVGAGVTPWLVFDHFGRMPPRDAADSFFSALAWQVGINRLDPHATRLILVDHGDVPGEVNDFVVRAWLTRIGERELAPYLMARYPALTPEAAAFAAQVLVIDARARCAAVNDTAERNFMAFLAHRLARLP